MLRLFGDIRLGTLGMSAKLLFTAALLTLGTGYLFAIGNVTMKVGLLPDQVALKYYGNEASRAMLGELQDDSVADATSLEEEEAFSFDDLDEAPGMSEEALVSVPTLETLVSEGHFHLFGYTSIFFICGLIMLLADIRPMLKHVIIVAPFLASVLDIWSMLLTRFIGPGFSWMMIISGTIMAISFLFVFCIAIYQMWFRKSVAAAPVMAVLMALILVPSANGQIMKAGGVVSLREGLVTMLQGEGALKMSKLTIAVDQHVSDSLRSAHGVSMAGSYTLYRGLDESGEMIGSVVIMNEDGKEGPLQMLVALRPDGTIYDLGFTVFGEDKGKSALQYAYLRQFVGKATGDPITLGNDIDGVSGATWTSTSVSKAVKRAVVLYDAFVLH